MIRMYLNKTGTNWLEWFPLTEFWYNLATHTSTSKSPFKVVQGQNPRNSINKTTTKEERKVKKKIREVQQRFKHYHDKKQRPYTIKMKDWI
jgi:hypothetical protein